MKLERKNGIPYYIQLKEQIQRNIASGQWPPGFRLPPERELASQLQLSRNTVSQAYKELESEGILASAQGKGTFVADTGVLLQQESRKEKVLRIIDNAMEEAVGLGFSIDDFVSFVHVRGMEKKATLRRLKVAFVEASTEQLIEFAGEAYLGREVTVVPINLADLEQDPVRAKEKLTAMDLVVTTFPNVNLVKHFLGGGKPAVVGINLEPKLETMVKIARLPLEYPLLLVCDSQDFATKVRTTLNQAGIYPELQAVTEVEDQQLAAVLARSQAVVVSSTRRQQVLGLATEQLQVIEFRTYPDAGSVNLLRSVLLEIKNS